MDEPFLGPALRLLDRFYPVKALLDVIVRLDPVIAAEGLASASRWRLDTAVTHWTSELPPSTADGPNSAGAGCSGSWRYI